VATRHQYCEPLHDYTSFDHETLMRDITDTIHSTGRGYPFTTTTEHKILHDMKENLSHITLDFDI